jgi:hypothetical protein
MKLRIEVVGHETAWVAIAERLVRPFGAVPFDPLRNGGAGFGEVAEVALPFTLFERCKLSVRQSMR